MSEIYYEKYLKYKLKYTQLKEEIATGGTPKKPKEIPVTTYIITTESGGSSSLSLTREEIEESLTEEYTNFFLNILNAKFSKDHTIRDSAKERVGSVLDKYRHQLYGPIQKIDVDGLINTGIPGRYMLIHLTDFPIAINKIKQMWNNGNATTSDPDGKLFIKLQTVTQYDIIWNYLWTMGWRMKMEKLKRVSDIIVKAEMNK